jgi:hypothetical protein
MQRVLQLNRFSHSASGDKVSLFPQIHFFVSSLLPHHFLLVNDITQHQERLALYTTFINDERRVTLSLSPSCPSLSDHD